MGVDIFFFMVVYYAILISMNKFLLISIAVGTLLAGGVSAETFFDDPTVCCQRSVEQKVNNEWKNMSSAVIWDQKSYCSEKNEITRPTGFGTTGNLERFIQTVVPDRECQTIVFDRSGNPTLKDKPPAKPGVWSSWKLYKNPSNQPLSPVLRPNPGSVFVNQLRPLQVIPPSPVAPQRTYSGPKITPGSPGPYTPCD